MKLMCTQREIQSYCGEEELQSGPKADIQECVSVLFPIFNSISFCYYYYFVIHSIILSMCSLSPATLHTSKGTKETKFIEYLVTYGGFSFKIYLYFICYYIS